MSSPGSATTLELPRRLLADTLAIGVIVAAVVAIEATLGRYPALPQGPGVLAGGILAGWQWSRRRQRPRAVALGPDAVMVLSGRAESPAPATGPRSRVLGRSVVLHWRAGGRGRQAWLTSADLPPAALRRLRVCCRSRHRAVVR